MDKTQAVELFRAYLKKGKNRVTPERFSVLDAVMNYEGHFSADELFLFMKNNNSTVSRATVYNTIDHLLGCRLLSMRNFGENLKKYESLVKKQSHDHLICTDCGRIIEFSSPQIKTIYETKCNELNFEPIDYSFNIFVKCKNKESCPFFNEK